jgi:hypothetical protein
MVGLFISFGIATLDGQRQLLTDFAKAVVDEVYNVRESASAVKT